MRLMVMMMIMMMMKVSLIRERGVLIAVLVLVLVLVLLLLLLLLVGMMMTTALIGACFGALLALQPPTDDLPGVEDARWQRQEHFSRGRQ